MSWARAVSMMRSRCAARLSRTTRFDGRSVLVTGSTGIAAAAALALHAEGARVFVVSRTAEHVDDLLRQLGPSCAGRRADLTQEAAVQSVVDDCVARFGRLDAV